MRSSHALALLFAVVGLVATGCSSSTNGPSTTVTKTGSAPAAPGGSGGASTPGSASPTTAAATTVAVKTLNEDGSEYGVGMPVIAFFGKKITDAKAWQDATKVTVNGKTVKANWYFETSSAGKGPIEGHLRPQEYWPAHASVHVDFPPAGTPLGAGFVSDGKLTSLDFTTGPRNIVTVDDSTNKMTVLSDGKVWDTFPVSLGSTKTRTHSGIKVIMDKGRDISMKGPGYYDAHVEYTQRLTYDGEYLHAAPWNTSNIANGINSSNGCTNMYTADAKKAYGFLRIGDVVTYPNADGGKMQLGMGYGDWNVDWGQWQTGGLVSTTS